MEEPSPRYSAATKILFPSEYDSSAKRWEHLGKNFTKARSASRMPPFADSGRCGNKRVNTWLQSLGATGEAGDKTKMSGSSTAEVNSDTLSSSCTVYELVRKETRALNGDEILQKTSKKLGPLQKSLFT